MATPYTGILLRKGRHISKCGLVLNINHLASVKLNKSNQTNFQCNFTNQTYSPSSSASPFPGRQCLVCCTLVSPFLNCSPIFFSSTLYRIICPIVLSATWCIFRTAPRSQNLLQKVSSNFTCLQKVS